MGKPPTNIGALSVIHQTLVSDGRNFLFKKAKNQIKKIDINFEKVLVVGTCLYFSAVWYCVLETSAVASCTVYGPLSDQSQK